MHIFLFNYILAYISWSCLYIYAQISTIESAVGMNFGKGVLN